MPISLHRWSLLLANVAGLFHLPERRDYKILAALPIGSSQSDIDRFSRAVGHYETNFTGTVDWALFHYKDIIVWTSQPWYNNSNIVLSIHEKQFAYYFFYKFLTVEYIPNIHEYDWVWLLVSDCEFDSFDAQTFVELLEIWNPGAAQPANTGFTPWTHTPLHIPSDVRIVNLVEIGPLLSIRVNLWESFRSLMNPDFNSGWGLDNLLCKFIAQKHNYTLDPFNDTEVVSSAHRVWLSSWIYSEEVSVVRRAPVRACPDPLKNRPVCIIVDATPLKHLDYHEGIKAGVYTGVGLSDVEWYRAKYPDIFVFWKNEISYCTSSMSLPLK